MGTSGRECDETERNRKNWEETGINRNKRDKREETG